MITGQHKVLLLICCNYNQNSDILIFFEIKIQDILNCLFEVHMLAHVSFKRIFVYIVDSLHVNGAIVYMTFCCWSIQFVF